MGKTEGGSEGDPPPKEPEKHGKGKKAIFTAIGVAAGVTAGAAGTLVLAPIALGALGFTSAGIAAGSIAAGMMSSAAIANGGAVAAGSLVAVLQSAGAVGLSAAATAATASAGGVIGGAVGFLAGNRTEKPKDPKPPGPCDDIGLSVPETGSPLDEEDSDEQEPGDSLVSMAPLNLSRSLPQQLRDELILHSGPHRHWGCGWSYCWCSTGLHLSRHHSCVRSHPYDGVGYCCQRASGVSWHPGGCSAVGRCCWPIGCHRGIWSDKRSNQRKVVYHRGRP